MRAKNTYCLSCSPRALNGLGADASGDASGGVTTITVTPDACQQRYISPQGSGYTGIDALDWAQYYLCLMGQDVANGASWLTNELVGIWNSLYNWLNGIVGQIENVLQDTFGSVYDTVKQAAQQLWSQVQNLWNQWQQAWSQFTGGIKLLAIAAVIGIGYYVARKVDKKARA